MLTIPAVDPQEREQVAGPASQVHNHLVQMFRKREVVEKDVAQRAEV
jgi:hypothetical protein